MSNQCFITRRGGGTLTKSVIIAKAPTGSTVTCTKGDVVKRATEKNGEWRFNGLDVGTWTLRAEMSGKEPATLNFEIKEFGVYRVELTYFLTAADFTFSGVKGTDYEIVQDDGTVIPEQDYTKHKDWKAKVFTTITVTPKRDCDVDVFAVGGGSGSYSFNSGAGGYTKTQKVHLTAGTPYTIEVGSGGAYKSSGNKAGDGGTTSGFGVTASGAKGAYSNSSADGRGGDGASGGCGYADGGKRIGGVDGNDGQDGPWQKKGYGQRTKPGPNGETGSTREFGEPGGALYASGGCVSGGTNDGLTGPNSGRGGDNGKPGESGIFIFRNAR